MAEEIKIEGIEKTRRSAIKTAAQVAVTAPAVGLLLSAGTKSAQAYVRVQSEDNATGTGRTADDLADAGMTTDGPFIGDDLFTF